MDLELNQMKMKKLLLFKYQKYTFHHGMKTAKKNLILTKILRNT
jgi:hypothetical protein